MSVDCEQVLTHARPGSLSPEQQAHVDTCARCRARLAVSGALERLHGPEPHEDSLARIRTRALAELVERPHVPPWWRDALLLVGLTGLMGVVGTVMMEPERLAHPPHGALAFVGGLLLLVLMMVSGALLALAPGGRRWRPLVLGVALLTALGVGLGGAGLSDGRPFVLAGLRCMMGEWLVSLMPWAVGLWMLRQVPARPLRTLAASLSGGTAGLLMLHLYCPIGTRAHLLTFHVLPWLVLAALAVPLRQRLPSRAYAP
jgi:hypothetical protein